MNRKPNTDSEKIVRQFLSLLGEDIGREGLKETPARVSRAVKELFSGYSNPKDHLEKIFSRTFKSDIDTMVIQTGIPVLSFCEHHCLPFYGTCNIGYIPDGKVIGASKLTRIVEHFARRLQIQEQLTNQIAEAIDGGLKCKGIMVTMRCKHLCMMYRGIKTHNTPLITSKILGVFAYDGQAREEFLALAKEIPDLF